MGELKKLKMEVLNNQLKLKMIKKLNDDKEKQIKKQSSKISNLIKNGLGEQINQTFKKKISIAPSCDNESSIGGATETNKKETTPTSAQSIFGDYPFRKIKSIHLNEMLSAEQKMEGILEAPSTLQMPSTPMMVRAEHKGLENIGIQVDGNVDFSQKINLFMKNSDDAMMNAKYIQEGNGEI